MTFVICRKFELSLFTCTATYSGCGGTRHTYEWVYWKQNRRPTVSRISMRSYTTTNASVVVIRSTYVYNILCSLTAVSDWSLSVQLQLRTKIKSNFGANFVAETRISAVADKLRRSMLFRNAVTRKWSQNVARFSIVSRNLLLSSVLSRLFNFSFCLNRFG